MKKTSFYAIGMAGLLANQVFAGTTPRGSLLELHSCELYAGGCVVSSESTLGGRYMLRAWNFADGQFANENLNGLQLAVVEASSENLAADHSLAGQAVVYLPQQATAAQREALAAWLKANVPDLNHAALNTRIVPLEFKRTAAGYAFSAGNFVSVQTASLESCETGSCGESLWYSPRATTSVFSVAADRSSQVTEPLLQLKWTDAGKRSVFLGKFGEAGASKDVYVTAADLCGPSASLF